MPSVRSQMQREKAAAEAAAAAKAEAEASLGGVKRTAAVLRAVFRSALSAADEDFSTVLRATTSAAAHNELLSKQLADCEAALEATRLNAERARTEASQERLRADSLASQLVEERAAAASLEMTLREAHDAVATARDVELPMAVRRTEAQRARADQAEADNARLRQLLAARAHTIREALGHFEALAVKVAPDDDQTLDALAQSALASFGTLYAEKALHSDSRFGALQDVLVKLCMVAGSLSSWLPWWVATRRAEAAALEQEIQAESSAADAFGRGGLSEGETDTLSPQIALSPETALSPEMSLRSTDI